MRLNKLKKSSRHETRLITNQPKRLVISDYKVCGKPRNLKRKLTPEVGKKEVVIFLYINPISKYFNKKNMIHFSNVLLPTHQTP